MPKLAITGHTKGIGKSIYETFSSRGYDVIGFSRSNGYDITSKESRVSILQQLEEIDIFVNNAYAPLGQKDLLKEAIDLWDGQNKTIVNINSKTMLMPILPEFLKEYAEDKRQQKDTIMNRIFKGAPHIINITIGLVDTDMAAVFESKKINPKDLADFVYHLISIRKQLAVQDILIEVPELDWNNIKHNK
jgi:NADP-dependent 3-hydroxy acid dehydrogenase YdfG